ncbi:MAG: undecaprenyl-diphosphatase UppP [Anaerolineales bacterium]|nr:undecaprenyl-diphosphatase UppP [Anaerolineales bacterium]
MTFFQAIVLGVIQGATEFLPISSSGHLVLLPWLLGWQINPDTIFIFDILVQWGTLVAVIAYFHEDLIRLILAAFRGLRQGTPWKETDSRLAWLLALASIPAAAVGLLIKQTVAFSFNNPAAASAFLLVTAALLVIAEKVQTGERSLDQMKPSDALWVGVFQILALFPGVSRSGSTITGGLIRGFDRETAARFSFLMSIPIMLGAGILALLDLSGLGFFQTLLPALLLGTASAAVVGYLAIHWLLKFISTNKLTVFAWYCLLLGAGGLIFYALKV